MNQILDKKLYQNTYNKSINRHLKFKKFLSFQLIFSLLVILSIFIFFLLNNYYQSNKEKYGKSLLKNYDILQLYSSSNNSSNYSNNISIIGIIDIPKINVKYTIFSNYTDDLLRISPCKIYGPNPGDYGNLCIISHNYDNDMFFSKISRLENNDEIYIYDIYNKKFIYYVYEKYEVEASDSSPIYFYERDIKQLTLITCNNKNKTRIIIKARMENK